MDGQNAVYGVPPAREHPAMNLFGIGNMELLLVLVVALLVLGPGRMVDTARTLGKFWAEAQRTLRSAADAATVRLDEPLGRPAEQEPPAPEGAVARGGEEAGDAQEDRRASAPKEGEEPEGPRG